MESDFRIVDQGCLFRKGDIMAKIRMTRSQSYQALRKKALQREGTIHRKVLNKHVGHTRERERKQDCLEQGGCGNETGDVVRAQILQDCAG